MNYKREEWLKEILFTLVMGLCAILLVISGHMILATVVFLILAFTILIF